MQTVNEPLILKAIRFADLAALDFPEDATPEQIAEIEAAWEAELDQRFSDIQEKFTALRRVMERETFLAEQHDPEINALKRELDARLQGRKRHEAHLERVKRYAARCLQALGTSVTAEGFEFKLQKNGGSPKVEVTDREQIPEKYRIPQPWQPDTKLIGLDVEKGGETVPGAVVSRGVHLRIKAA